MKSGGSKYYHYIVIYIYVYTHARVCMFIDPMCEGRESGGGGGGEREGGCSGSR